LTSKSVKLKTWLNTFDPPFDGKLHGEFNENISVTPSGNYDFPILSKKSTIKKIRQKCAEKSALKSWARVINCCFGL